MLCKCRCKAASRGCHALRRTLHACHLLKLLLWIICSHLSASAPQGPAAAAAFDGSACQSRLPAAGFSSGGAQCTVTPTDAIGTEVTAVTVEKSCVSRWCNTMDALVTRSCVQRCVDAVHLRIVTCRPGGVARGGSALWLPRSLAPSSCGCCRCARCPGPEAQMFESLVDQFLSVCMDAFRPT